MAHPQMFRETDPVYQRVREMALSLPGAMEKVSHGRPAFYTRKVFCYYGASVRADGAWVQHEQAVVVLLEDSEREAVLCGDGTFVPAYLGPSGWVGVDLTPEADWVEVGELLEASFRRTAPSGMVARLPAS
jgi:YjbR